MGKRECLRCSSFSLPTVAIVIVTFMLCQTPPPVSGFGQGTQIQANFGVYCNRPASQRFPVHYDVTRCRGLCAPKNDVRNIFTLRVNATSYFRDSVRVSVTADPRGGFRNNIRGFAVVAITEDERIVGGFLEQPDALIASCDPLMEGDTAFHARASLSRRSVTLTWLPDSRNYGTIRFRVWIVVQHFDVYVLDSHYLENEISGSDQYPMTDNFYTFILQVFNISRSAVTFTNDDDDNDDTSITTVANDALTIATIANDDNDDDDDNDFSDTDDASQISDSRRTTLRVGTSSTSSSLFTNVGGIPIRNNVFTSSVKRGTAVPPGATPATATNAENTDKNHNTGSSDSVTTSNTNGIGRSSNNNDNTSSSSNNNNGRPNSSSSRNNGTVSVLVSLSSNRSMELTIPTLSSFEQAFERRLTTTGFDINAADPFETLNREIPTFRDLFPKLDPPSGSPLSAPFAPTSGSPFSQTFGAGQGSGLTPVSSTTRIRQTFNQLFSNLGQPQGGFGSPGQNPNPNSNPFGNSGGANQNPNQNVNTFGSSQIGATNPFRFGGTNQNLNQNTNAFGTANPFSQPTNGIEFPNNVNTLQRGTNTNSGFNQFGQPSNTGNGFGFPRNDNAFSNPNNGFNANQFGQIGRNAFGFPTNGNAFQRPNTNTGFTSVNGNGIFPSSQNSPFTFPGSNTQSVQNSFGSTNIFPSTNSLLSRFSQFNPTQNGGSGTTSFPAFGQQNNGNNFFAQTPGNRFFGQNPGNSLFAQNSGNSAFGQNQGNGAFGQNQGNGAFRQNQGNGAFRQNQGNGAFGQNQGNSAFGQSPGNSFFGQNSGNGAFGQSAGNGAFGQNQGNGAFGQSPGNSFFGQNSGNGAFGQNQGNSFFGQSPGNGLFGQQGSFGNFFSRQGFPGTPFGQSQSNSFGSTNQQFPSGQSGQSNINPFTATRQNLNGNRFNGGGSFAGGQPSNFNPFNSGGNTNRFQTTFGQTGSLQGSVNNFPASTSFPGGLSAQIGSFSNPAFGQNNNFNAFSSAGNRFNQFGGASLFNSFRAG